MKNLIFALLSVLALSSQDISGDYSERYRNFSPITISKIDKQVFSYCFKYDTPHIPREGVLYYEEGVFVLKGYYPNAVVVYNRTNNSFILSYTTLGLMGSSTRSFRFIKQAASY